MAWYYRVTLVVAVCLSLSIYNIISFNGIIEHVDLIDEDAPDKEVVFQSQILSPLCNPVLPQLAGIKRIVFGHMRKAGGTTISAFLKKVAGTYNMTFKGFEGGYIELPGTRNDTLYVTHIRNPVERAMSHYKYEGRWKCVWLVNDEPQKLRPEGWEPTFENSNTLENWMREKCTTKNEYMWHCFSNCFIRWLNHPIGHCDDEGSQFANATLYQSALDKAQKFHLIIQTEKLRENDYVESLGNYFGVSPDILKKKNRIYCDDESKAANKAYPANVTDAHIKTLSELNVADLRFFAEFSTCPTGIQFPTGSLKDLL